MKWLFYSSFPLPATTNHSPGEDIQDYSNKNMYSLFSAINMCVVLN